MIVTTAHTDVAGPAGPIRCLVARPKSAPARAPAVLCYSDIFQLTPPTVRLAQRLAGHGFVVVAPELYGRIEPPGTALDFDRDRQRALDDSDKMTVEQLDADARAVMSAIQALAGVDPERVGVMGFCFGGHLAFRAALSPEIKAAACCYATGLHDGKLGATADARSLERAAELSGELLLVWGRGDPHIPPPGRARIHRALDDAGVRFEARLFDAEHAFMRDEGPRYDPDCADRAFGAIVELFRRAL